MGKTGVYAVYWESKKGMRLTKPVSGAPPEVKAMIAQQLLDDLGVKIRISP